MVDLFALIKKEITACPYKMAPSLDLQTGTTRLYEENDLLSDVYLDCYKYRNLSEPLLQEKVRLAVQNRTIKKFLNPISFEKLSKSLIENHYNKEDLLPDSETYARLRKEVSEASEPLLKPLEHQILNI